jgi:hypothetical protein
MMWVHGDPLTGTKNWERRQVPIIPAMQRLLKDLRSKPRAVSNDIPDGTPKSKA